MAPRVYPCLCGALCSTYARMRHHRRKCEVWQKRPNARELAKERRSAGRQPAKKGACNVCGGRPDHHLEGCPNSLEEKVRRGLLERYGISAEWFELFLEVLKKRYWSPDKGWRQF